MSFALDRQRFIIMGIVSQTSVVCLLLGLSSAKDVPAFYIFGDSLVDVGNNFYMKTLATPLFPNGIDFGNGYRVPSGRYSNARLVPDIIGNSCLSVHCLLLRLRYVRSLSWFSCFVLTGQEVGLKNFPPPCLAPTTVGDVLLNGVNYASSGSGILKATGESYVSIYFRRRIHLALQKLNFHQFFKICFQAWLEINMETIPEIIDFDQTSKGFLKKKMMKPACHL